MPLSQDLQRDLRRRIDYARSVRATAAEDMSKAVTAHALASVAEASDKKLAASGFTADELKAHGGLVRDILKREADDRARRVEYARGAIAAADEIMVVAIKTHLRALGLEASDEELIAYGFTAEELAAHGAAARASLAAEADQAPAPAAGEEHDEEG